MGGSQGRRFVIDGSMARRGGGFTYLVNIVPELSRAAPGDRFRVLVADERLAAEVPRADNVEVLELDQPRWLDRFRYTFLEAPRMAAEWGADLYFSAAEYAPLWAPCPVIASFRNPNVFTWEGMRWALAQKRRLGLLYLLSRLSAWRCAGVLFVSEDSARWIGDSVGLPPERRHVVHHGIDLSRFAADPGPRPLERPYILSVSTVYRYKNYLRLMEGWEALAVRRPDLPDLVIVGDDQDPPYTEQMEALRRASPLSEHIHLLGEVPYAQVRRYYAHASLFVFPSYLETFGHPLLEAMASAAPLVAADIPVFREIAGDAALYANPHSAAALAGAMERVLAEPALAEALVVRGRARVRELTWERSARGLLALFDAVLARGRAGARSASG